MIIDIVFFVLDDVARTDYEQLRVQLPIISRMEAEGQSFTSCYSMPVCSSTRFGYLSGKYGRRIGLGGIVTPTGTVDVPDTETTLADELADAGYGTAHFGKWHISSQFVPTGSDPADFGFDHWAATHAHNLDIDGGNYSSWTRHDIGQAPFVETEYATSAVIDAFIAWWQTTPSPKFAHVALAAPHLPFHVPPQNLLPDGYPFPTTVRERYESMLIAADHEIGRAFTNIDFQSTWVFLFGDNGTPINASAPGQNPAHVKGTVYEDGVNVPLIARGPDSFGPPSSNRRQVGLTDLFATAREIAALPGAVPGAAPFDSFSFASALGYPSISTRRSFSFSEYYTPNGFGAHALHLRMVRKGSMKLVVKLDQGVETTELYSLFNDPSESSPIVDPRLEDKLRALMDSVGTEIVVPGPQKQL
jgi:arylsulfatase A-like enzyme